MEIRYVQMHGHRRAYAVAGPPIGTAPVVLLVHGIASEHSIWSRVIEQIGERYTVIAPDLLGHGLSDAPIADYSLGDYANSLRDLMTILHIDTATVVGHSYGGGVAMQFGYQYPERTERVMIVSSGGLGPQVAPAIRAISFPGSGLALWLISRKWVRDSVGSIVRRRQQAAAMTEAQVDQVVRGLERLADPAKRMAMQKLVRSVIDPSGQYVSMRDRIYLWAGIPLAVVWGQQDGTIPVTHAKIAGLLAPRAHITTIPSAGHMVMIDEPEAFLEAFDAFMEATRDAVLSRDDWEAVLRGTSREAFSLGQ